MTANSIKTESDQRSATLTNSRSASSPCHSSQESTSTRGNSNIPNRLAINDNLELPVPGWPRLAQLMATTPDFAAFSRFRDLNVKSLLYYQVELTELRKSLDKLERSNCYNGDSEVREYANRADYLIDSRHDKHHAQWDLVVRMRELLKEYNAALLQYSQVSALPEPDSYNIESLRVWLKREGDGHYFIKGAGDDIWGNLYEREKDRKSLMRQFLQLLRSIFWSQKAPPNKLDLVATRPPQNIDGLTHWVANNFVPFYHELRNTPWRKNVNDVEKTSPIPKEKVFDEKQDGIQSFNSLETYSEKRILKFTSSVATVIACLLPTLSIAILSKVHETEHLVIYIAGFTAIFAVGLMFLTNAATSRVEIFTATAAFSAVLVVFVQNA